MSAATAPIVAVLRDCDAIAVPSGITTVLPAGTLVQLVQSIEGGAVTVRTSLGGLLRIDPADSDAVGITHDPGVRGGSDAAGHSEFSMDRVTEALHTVYDPEIPVDVVELGLVYRCEERYDESQRRRIEIDLSTTAPGCGMGDVLCGDVERVVRRIPGVDDVLVTLVFDPPWCLDRISDAARLRLGLL
jgi:probable FeS assembly SUF system protein SufT